MNTIKQRREYILFFLTLFMFLFNFVWTAPLGILVQKFTITNLFLLDNQYIHIVLITVFILLIISLFYSTIYKILVFLTLFLIISSCLYQNILPYNFGAFIDDQVFSPTRSFLGFSPWYYGLDFIILVLSFSLAYVICYKKQVQKFCGICLIYFIIELGVVSSQIRFSEYGISTEYVISKNHKNALVFFYDGLDPSVLRYYLTKDKLLIDKNILKDFTFFSKSLSPSFTGTALSLPAIYAGEERSAQIVLSKLLNEYYNNPFYYEPLVFLKSLINNKLMFNNTQKIQQINSFIPILSIRIYQSIPYFSRFLLVKPFNWKYLNLVQWGKDIGAETSISFTSKNTEKNTYNFIFSDKTHIPWKVDQTNISLENVMNKEDFEVLLRHNYSEALETVRESIDFLKKNDVYDNTMLIIVSDHGGHLYGEKKDVIKEYYNSLNSLPDIDNSFFFYSTTLLIKNFNEKTPAMKYNDKLVSPLLLKESIFTALGLTNGSNYFTNDQVLVFNIPSINSVWALGALNTWEKSKNIIINSNTMLFHRVSNIRPYQYHTFEVSIEEISNIPAFERVE